MAGVGVLGVVMLFVLVWAGALGPLPDRQALMKIEHPQASVVYSADTVLLGRFYIEDRSNITYYDIPKHVEQALLATEDVRFYEHGAVDWRSFFRVLGKSILLQQESSGGGSTITQQLAKNLYPRRQYVMGALLINKIREIIIANRLEAVLGKRAILTLYLNTIPFSDNTFGIETAALRFFNKSTRDLLPEEGAVLVGMLKATHRYNPRLYPDRARQRRNVVLAQMSRYGWMPPDQLKQLQQLPLRLHYNRITHHDGLAPYFREYIRQQLDVWCREHQHPDGTPYNLYTDGLTIYTTLNARLQQHAEAAVAQQMKQLQQQFDVHWGKKAPWYQQPEVVLEAARRATRYQTWRRQGLTEAEILTAMAAPVSSSRFDWGGEQEVTWSPLDSIRHHLRFLQTGMLALDIETGAVQVWVGGIDHHFFQYDHVRPETRRQAGSTFKPVVYAAALESGVSPCDYISGSQTTYTTADQQTWTPRNAHDDANDQRYSMEGSLAQSVNTVAVKLLERAGIEQTITLAQRLGITSPLPAVPSLALGVADVSLSEMVSAYASFANGGYTVRPYCITHIMAPSGAVLDAEVPPAVPERAMRAETARMMVHMLQRTVNEGTGAALRTRFGLTNDMGGKTGTTQANADGWFIAITPKLAVGAWVGADDRRVRFRTTALGQGAATALPLVGRFFTQLNRDPQCRSLMRATFAPLPDDLQRRMDCTLYRDDATWLEKIFGKREKQQSTPRPFQDGTARQKRKFKWPWQRD